MDIIATIGAIASTVSALATVVYVVLTHNLTKTAVAQANQARVQADAAFQALQVARQPHLLLSPHPSARDAENSVGFIVNFGNLPVDVLGGWIESLDEGRQARGGFQIKQFHTKDESTFLNTMERVEVELIDYQLSPGWYVLRVMFGYPTYPNQVLLFDVLMHKVDHHRTYFLRDVSYVLEDYIGDPPTTRLAPKRDTSELLKRDRIAAILPLGLPLFCGLGQSQAARLCSNSAGLK